MGRPILAADPLSSGSSRLESRLRARLPAPQFLRLLRAAPLLGLWLAAAVGSAQQVIDRIAVVVGKSVITESEVEQEVRLEAFLNGTPLKLDADTRKAAADRLVDQELIRNEMKVGAYSQPEPVVVEATVRNLKKDHFGGSDAAYRASLQKYGISDELLRKHLAWQLAAIHFTDMRFAGPAPATATPANPKPGPDRSTQGGLLRRQEATPQTADRTEATPAANVDEQLDAWLKQTRAATKIQFKQGAFQ